MEGVSYDIAAGLAVILLFYLENRRLRALDREIESLSDRVFRERTRIAQEIERAWSQLQGFRASAGSGTPASGGPGSYIPIQ